MTPDARDAFDSPDGHGPGGHLPPEIPDHQLIQRIGRGSYGEVWLGRNVAGTLRAIKIVWRDTFDDCRPFEREFAGVLKYEPVSRTHEGLMDLLHIGRNDDAGYFFCVMELADALEPGTATNQSEDEQSTDGEGAGWSRAYTPKTLRSLLQRQRRLPPAECIRIGIFLADALEHLHQGRLVHRDIKPSNVIFVAGRPKLADIGLVTDVDEAGTLVGTQGYLPPEGPGTRQADVFSLGKVLYEISTGKDRGDFPAPPTDLIASNDRFLLQELNEIVLRACEPDPARRYPSMAALRADLLLAQAGESVHRTRLLEHRFRRFRRIAAGLLGALVLAGASVYLVERERNARLRADLDHQQRLVQAAIERTALTTQLASQAVEQYFDSNRPREAILRLAGELERDRTNRVVAERLLSALTERSFALPLLPVLRHAQGVTTARWGPDGSHVLTASLDGTARLWRLAKEPPALPPLVHGAPIRWADISPDGAWAVTAGDDGSAQLWDGESGRAIGPRLKHEAGLRFVEFSPDRRVLATAADDGTVKVWMIPNGTIQVAMAHHRAAVRTVRFSPDGTRLVTAAADGTAGVWNVATGQLMGQRLSHETPVNWAEFSPDGAWVVTAADDGAARVWDAQTGGLVATLRCHPAPARMASFSPDGTRILTASMDGTSRVWDYRTGRPMTPALRHEEPVITARFSPEGLRVLTASRDDSARVWDAFSGEPLSEPLAHRHALAWAEFSPDGQRVVTASQDATACVWDVFPGAALHARVDYGHRIPDAQWSPNGTQILAALASPGDGTNGGVEIRWTDRQDPAPVSEKTPSTVELVRFSADGRLALAVCEDHSVWTWDVAGSRRLQNRIRHDRTVEDAAFSPDGRWLATASADGSVRLWTSDTGLPVGAPLNHDGAVHHVRFSSDGRTLLTASSDARARLWLLPPNGGPLLQLPHGSGVSTAEFSPDGHTILTASEDGLARLWDAKDGRPIGKSFRHDRGLSQAQFSPSGDCLITLTERHRAFLWNPQLPGGPRNPQAIPEAVQGFEFSPDGTRLVTWTTNREARVWDTHTAQPLSELMKHESPVAVARFRPDGQAVATASVRGRVSIWQSPRLAGAAPDWLPRLARLLALAPSDEDWQVAPAVELERIRRQVLAGRSDDEFTRWGTWFLAHRPDRNATPYGETKVNDYIHHRLMAPDLVSVYEVAQLQPTNAGAWARLWAGAKRAGDDGTNRALATVAEHGLGRMAERDPHNRVLLWAAIEAWVGNRHCEQGVAAMDRVLNRQPAAINPWIAKGHLLEIMGLHESSRAAYRQALSLVQRSQNPPDRLRQTLLLKPASLLRRLGRHEEARIEFQSPRSIPGRDPTLGPGAIDLSAFYNATFDEAWYDFTVSATHCLETPSGWQGGGVRSLRVDMRGLIQLTNPTLDRTAPGFPPEVTGIPLGLAARRICFVHASCGLAPEGSVVGHYVLHYANDNSLTIPIRYGPDVRTWSGPDGCAIAAAPFQENRQDFNSAGETVRVFSTLWTNTVPGIVISALDFQSARGPAAPLLIAVTLD